MSSARPRRWPPLPAGLALVALVGVLALAGLATGPSDVTLGDALTGLLATLGLGDPLAEPTRQAVVELRLWRSLAAGGVGGGLALAGALLQGLFRNGLASPSVLGVTAGATFGATLAIASVAGAAPSLAWIAGGNSTFLVTTAGLFGALATAFGVFALARSRGRLSVPTLLLAGIAANTLLAAGIALVQSLALEDLESSRAVFAWTFGTLDDRSGGQAWIALAGVALALAFVPFVARELDLLAGGEEEARALGVPVGRVHALVLVGAAVATATSVAVAGQIGFIGLVVPHGVRMLVGRAHRAVLPLSVLVGAAFLLGCDIGQRAFLGDTALRTGVLMSLIGGPVFLALLVRHRRTLEAW